MENYEINILKRNGDWKKINPNDLLLKTAKEDSKKINTFFDLFRPMGKL